LAAICLAAGVLLFEAFKSPFKFAEEAGFKQGDHVMLLLAGQDAYVYSVHGNYAWIYVADKSGGVKLQQVLVPMLILTSSAKNP
jgi:hypothetical protein